MSLRRRSSPLVAGVVGARRNEVWLWLRPESKRGLTRASLILIRRNIRPDNGYPDHSRRFERPLLLPEGREGEASSWPLAWTWGAGQARSRTGNRLWLPVPASLTVAQPPWLPPRGLLLVQPWKISRCGALDGVAYGMVQDTAAFQAAFDLRRDVPNCTGGGRDGTCLTEAQKGVIASI